MSYLIRYEIRDTHLVEESVMMTLKDKADFSNFKPRPFNMREFYDRTGHDIKEMLLSCYFRGSECSPEDFSVVSMNANFVSGAEGLNLIGGDWNDRGIGFTCFLDTCFCFFKRSSNVIYRCTIDLSRCQRSCARWTCHL